MPKQDARLEESRIQGTLNFPCTMYRADSSSLGAPPHFFVKPHWHNAFELLHFEKGSFGVNINMRQQQVDSEAFCFVECEKLHSVHCKRPYLEQALLFDPSILSSGSLDESTRSLIDPLIHKSLSFPLLVLREDNCFAELQREFRHLLEIFTRSGEAHDDQLFLHDPSAQLRVKASILTILAAVAEEGLLHNEEVQEDPRVSALKELMVYIQSHYTEKIYLSELADIMHMNEQYFSRFFSRTTGRTPIAYINDIRIRKAALLLSDPGEDLSILEIATACGFMNSGHFITEFKKRIGLGPKTYRLSKKQTLL